MRSQILDGRRRGGEWLREEDLAGELGVSRTPVREALRRLAADGLVRHEPHRGVQVQDWSLDDLEEIFELRGLLEPVGARLAATSPLLDLEVLEGLASRIELAATVRDIDTVTSLNNEFHAAVVTASGSRRLGGLLSSLVQVPIVHSTFAHYTPTELTRSLGQHREILEALRSGDADWAESVMRSHIRHGWVAIRGRLLSAS
ncbi:UNVERIFIED_CONTAM: hypothetical protein LK11_04460 [Mumia flava]